MLKSSARLGLLFILAFSLIVTACSSNKPAPTDNGKNGAGQNKDNQQGSGEKALPPYEVNIAFWGADQKDLGLIEQELSKITEAKFNATIKLKRYESAAWSQQKALMFAGNEQVDLLFTGELQYASEVAQKKLIPLDELLQSHGQGILEAFQPEILGAAKVEGVTYAVPSIRDLASYPAVLMRADILKEMNIDASQVDSLEKVEEVFKQVKAKHPELNMIGKASGGASLAYPLLLPTIDPLGDSIGVLTDITKLNVVNLYESPEYEAFIRTMHRWYKAGYLPKDIGTTTQTAREYVKAKIGFSTPNKGKPGAATQTGQWVGMELIETKLAKPKTNTMAITNAMMGIARNSRDPERAMMVLNLLYTDKDFVNLLHWGIEGKHYVVKENGTVTYPEGVDASNTGYNLRQGWMFGNQLLAYPWETDSPDIWDQMKAFNDSAERSAALGFMFNSEPVKTEVAAIQNVIDQFARGLETGSLDPDEYLPKFNQALKAANIQKILDEKQKQLDAWAASQ